MFSALQESEAYERLQADITDHVFAVPLEFDLLAFQALSSAHVRAMAGDTSRVDVRRLRSSHRDKLGAEQHDACREI